LPFGAIENRRSFVHVDDLARLLIACAGSARPARLYLAANSASVPSTTLIVSLMRAAFGRSARLARVPVAILETIARIAGQSERIRRLTRSLEVDASDAERELGWRAAVPINQAVAEMVAAYRGEEAR
jgi:nucleoside-diphosphate-sugar epimerase